MEPEFRNVFKPHPAKLERRGGVSGAPIWPGDRAHIVLVDSPAEPHDGWTVAQENITEGRWEVVIDTSNLTLHPSEKHALETARALASRVSGAVEAFSLTSYYACDTCDTHWQQDWPGTPDDKCMSCGTPDISPYYHHPNDEPCNEDERAAFESVHSCGHP